MAARISRNDALVHSPISRRRFLQIGGVGTLGLLLGSSTKEVSSIIPITGSGINPGKSLILIVLQGGLSHFDSFDPRDPNIDSNIRGPFKRIETSTKGIYVTEPLQNIALQMDKILVVRNLFHNDGNHSNAMSILLVGDNQTESNDLYAESVNLSPLIQFSEYLSNTGSQDVGYVVMHHSEGREDENTTYSPDSKPYSGVHTRHQETIYVPWDFNKASYRSPFTEEFDKEKYRERKNLLDKIEKTGIDLHSPQIDRYIKMHKKADSLLDGTFNESLDLSKEPEEIREKYGRNPLGNALLTARRMVQRGARIVVANDGDYDSHSCIEKNLRRLLGRLDKALSALIEEKEKLGLPVVIAVISEFGRTPSINLTKGRDHWPDSFSMLLCGDGIEGGRVIGEVNNDGKIKGDALEGRFVGETLLNSIGYARVHMRGEVQTRDRLPSLISAIQ